MERLVYISLDPHTVRLSDSPEAVEQTILREGRWRHAGAPGGELVLDKPRLDELARNFRAGVGLGGDSLPFHFGHTEDKDERSVAWGSDVRVVPDEKRPGLHKMVSRIDFTSDGNRKAVLGGEYAFTSPTIHFNVKDRDTGETHGAVLRNVAFTNYPFIQKMGRAQVVNLSEVALAAKDAGMDFASGGPAAGEPNPDGLPKGYDVTELPKECLGCARLGNDCPFAGPDAAGDLTLKQAAAGRGNCPQYVPADSQSPGGDGAGGGEGGPAQNPAAGRTPGAARLDDGEGGGSGGGDADNDDTDLHDPAYGRMLFSADEAGGAGRELNGFAARHGAKMHRALRRGHLARFDRKPDGAKRGDGKAPAAHVRITRAGQAALASRPERAATVAMSEDAGGAAAPAKGTPMNKAQIDKMAAKMAEVEAGEQRAFVTALAEEHKLPAATLKAVEDAMRDGAAVSLKLSEALEGADATLVRLSEKPEEAVTRPPALDKVSELDLSEMITLPRAAFRDAILAAARAERTGEVKLDDTKETPGAPAKKKDDAPDDVAKAVQAERDPGKALEIARKAQAEGKLD